MKTLFSSVMQASKDADQYGNRNKYAVFASAVSEIGELGEELTIESGHSYKEPGPDGVLGEAVDTIVALLDLIYVHNPEITEYQLIEMAQLKTAKWHRKLNMHADRKQLIEYRKSQGYDPT